jgi:UDP-3-O-[3-hydroxymyristoyl] glucosamine N-acyltransferase
MNFTAEQIAGILNGEVEGNPETEVSTLSKIEEGSKESLTFLANPKYTPFIYTTKASIIIVNKTFKAEQQINATLIKVDDAYKAFSTLLNYYNQIRQNKTGIEKPHFISDSATYGDDIYIGAFTYIGNDVKIGNNVKIYPNCYIGDNVTIADHTVIHAGSKIYFDCVIGQHCVVNSGVIIGADGFGFAPNEKGEYEKIPQIGNVILEDYVDVGANSTIDRATLGSTIIRRGVKLDNHIQIAHNVEIGKNTVIAAQTGIAGSTKVGENCQIGGQVGMAGHLIIGNNVRIQAQSGIGKNIKDGEILQGSPSFNYGDWSKSYIHFKNLPKLVKQINQIEKKINGNS